MAKSIFDSRQTEYRSVLSAIGSVTKSTLDTILAKVDKHVDVPLRLSASFPTADAVLNISAYTSENGDGTAKSAGPIKSSIVSFPASTINFQTQATTGGTFDITFPASTVGYYRRAGFSLLSTGTLKVIFSAEQAVFGNLADPGTLLEQDAIRLGWIDLECTHASGLFKTAGSSTSIIENSVSGTPRIFRLRTDVGANESLLDAKDEDVLISSGVTEINFKGSGVSAAEVSPGHIEVTVPGSSATLDKIMVSAVDGYIYTSSVDGALYELI
jgi:hypothetical protein